MSTPKTNVTERELIDMVNKLQSNLMNTMQTADALNLPRIVVLGAQSTGKSSVLENIVRRDFLPRGTGIVTRRPLVLRMSHMSDTELAVRKERGLPDTAAATYATFQDEPNVEYTDFSDVRSRIEKKTDELCGSSKQISRNPIELNVISTDCLDLTLVDLPGLTKVAVQGQDATIGEDIKAMALEWITPQNTLIVAVTAANTDIANSDSLQLAKTVDPRGERTIGVLTKLDLMDKGTDCTSVLTGRVYKLRRPWIGVVNRSQQDINDGTRIERALAAEEEFFAAHPVYSKLRGQLGTAHLRQVLYRALHSQIQAYSPVLKERLQELLLQCKERLKEVGEVPDMEPMAVLQQMLGKFADALKRPLIGRQGIKEKPRGAVINHHFNSVFVAELDSMTPWEDISDEAIRTQIASCSALRTQLLPVHDQVFEKFSRVCVQKLLQPALACADHIHGELLKLTHDASAVLERYPNLKDRVVDFMKGEFAAYNKPLEKHIHNLINTETARINISHPKFFGGGYRKELLGTIQQALDADTDDDLDAPVRILRRMVQEYYMIAKLDVQDHVPKAIMFHLVNKVRDEAYVHLVKEFLIQDEKYLEVLLHEHGDTLNKRKAFLRIQACVRESLDMLQKIKELRPTSM